MTIQEQPMQIEFTYKPEPFDENIELDLGNYAHQARRAEYNVVFHVEKDIPIVMISETNSNDGFNFSADFLAELVDFLRQKGAIPQSGKTASTLLPSNLSPQMSSLAAGIPIPRIIKKDSQVDAGPVIHSSHNKPLVSFDVNEEQIPDKNIVSTQSVAINKDVELSDAEVAEIKKRPVIKTRIIDEDDPLAAERDAATMRGSGDGKSIRRAE